MCMFVCIGAHDSFFSKKCAGTWQIHIDIGIVKMRPAV